MRHLVHGEGEQQNEKRGENLREVEVEQEVTG
jgi:hypothetical protein